jgi:hypothetical protein
MLFLLENFFSVYIYQINGGKLGDSSFPSIYLSIDFSGG